MKQAVFIINSLQSGGAERVVDIQGEYLRKQGYEVTFIFLRNRIQYPLNPEIHTLFLTEKENFGLADYLRGLLFLPRKLNAALDQLSARKEPDLLTAHLLFPHLITRLSRYGKKCLYVVHGMQDILPFSRSLPYKLFVRWLYQDRGVIGVSQGVTEELDQVYGLKQENLYAIENPLNMEELRSKCAEPLEIWEPFILYCGRLNPVKRPDRAVEAFYLGGFWKKYRLVMLGEGECLEDLRRQIKKLGITDRVELRGWESNVYKWMARASLMVISSQSESLSMVLIEALCCGCPVAAVKNPGVSQVMKGPLAEFLSAPHERDLARKMQLALEKFPPLTEHLEERFSPERNMEQYLAVYRGRGNKE